MSQVHHNQRAILFRHSPWGAKANAPDLLNNYQTVLSFCPPKTRDMKKRPRLMFPSVVRPPWSPIHSLRRRLVNPRSLEAPQRWGSSEQGPITGCLPACEAGEEASRRSRKRGGSVTQKALMFSPPLGRGFQVNSGLIVPQPGASPFGHFVSLTLAPTYSRTSINNSE